MNKRVLISLAVASSILAAATVFAGNFTVSTVSVEQAKQILKAPKTAATPINQLFICNSTQLPNQTGANINVAFPQAGVPTQTPGPDSCAYLQSSSSFATQVTIYTPAGSGYVDFNNTLSSGQMWSVTYNSQNNSYPVAQIQ